MTKSQNKKGTRNDERKNGKAAKQPDAPRVRTTSLTDVQKVLLGKGMLVRHLKNSNAPVNQPKRRKSED